MADLESASHKATIVGTILTVICTCATVFGTYLTWKMYLRGFPASGASGGDKLMPTWAWAALCAFGVLSVASLAVNLRAWWLQHMARKERAKVTQLTESLHESARSNLQYRAERDRALEDKHKLEKQVAIVFAEEWAKIDYIALRERGYQCALLFTPLQMEAFQVSKDIQAFMDDLGTPPLPKPEDYPHTAEGVSAYAMAFHESPWREWNLKLTGGYEQDLAPRVKQVYLSFKRDGYYQSPLSHYTEGVMEHNELGVIRELLIALAHQPNGIHLQVGSSNEA